MCYKSSKKVVLEAFRIWIKLEKIALDLVKKIMFSKCQNSLSHETSKMF